MFEVALVWLVFGWLVVFGSYVYAAETKRLALVIGNDTYQYVSKLEKAGNDASAMALELKAAGFEVDLRRDVNSIDPAIK
jgi:hypothetical protein